MTALEKVSPKGKVQSDGAQGAAATPARASREEQLRSRLAKLDAQREEAAALLRREQSRLKSRAAGEARKRRSRVLILMGAACEASVKAEAANSTRVLSLVQRYLAKPTDVELVAAFLHDMGMADTAAASPPKENSPA